MLVRILIVALLVALCLWLFGAAEVAGRLSGAHAGWIGVAIGCLLAQTALMALRWRLVAACLGLAFPVTWAIREYLIAQLVNLTLPGGVVGDGARVVRSRAGDDGLKRAAQAVVVERALGQIGLCLLAATGLIWSVAAPGALAWPPDLARGLAIAALIGLVGAVSAIFWLRRGRIADIVSLSLPNARIRRGQAALSVAAAALNVAAFAACARATGTTLSPQAALVIVPLILTAMLIPLTIGGWGWREGAAAALFPVAGATSAAGVATGIVFGAAMLLAALPALPFLALRRSDRPVITTAPNHAARVE